MKNQFTVTAITPTPNAKVPGFSVTIQRKDVIEKKTPLGLKRNEVQETYYMKVAEPSVKVKDVVSLDPDDYKIVEREFTIPEGDDKGKIVMLKWLQL